MKNKELIINYFDELFENPVCELIYEKDYELLISVMLSAQTKDSRVNEVTKVLYKKYNTLEKLANASLDDVKSIIKPVGTYNIKAANVIKIAKNLLENQNGIVPNDRTYLESLPGVGHKTVNVVLSILYNEPCFAVDTHVSRVSKRLKIAALDDTLIDIENKLLKEFKSDNVSRLHHQFLLFGRYYCKAINPECLNCKLKNICQKNYK